MPQAVDEFIRWTTPVKHFFRTAVADCEVGGQSVKAGDFTELLARIDAIELAGEPAWVKANFVSGLKRLPIRYHCNEGASVTDG